MKSEFPDPRFLSSHCMLRMAWWNSEAQTQGSAPAHLAAGQAVLVTGEISHEIVLVSDAVGGGGTTFDFPSFRPTALGSINWTVELADDDPDDDTATYWCKWQVSRS